MGEPIELKLTIAKPVARVFAALTGEPALTAWFAEHVRVDPGTRRYDFWGRYTPGAPDAKHGRHRLLAYEPPTHLSFEWSDQGADMVVDIRLTGTGDTTTLVLRQDDTPAYVPGNYTYSDFWQHALENLRRWLEDGREPARADMSLAQRDTVRLSAEIDAEPSRVFDGLLDAATQDRFFGHGTRIEPRPGGAYDFGWSREVGGPRKILDLEADRKLSYAWKCPDEPETVVTWELEGSGGRTRLTLVHSGFDDSDHPDYTVGWMNYLVLFRSLLECGEDWSPPAAIKVDHPAPAGR